MMYFALATLIALMLLYMFWHAGFSMRRDRIVTERASRRRFSRRKDGRR